MFSVYLACTRETVCSHSFPSCQQQALQLPSWPTAKLVVNTVKMALAFTELGLVAMLHEKQSGRAEVCPHSRLLPSCQGGGSLVGRGQLNMPYLAARLVASCACVYRHTVLPACPCALPASSSSSRSAAKLARSPMWAADLPALCIAVHVQQRPSSWLPGHLCALGR